MTPITAKLRHSLLLISVCAGLGAFTTVNASVEDLAPACWKLTFDEPFDTLSLWDADAGTGRWKTEYIWPRDVIINNELQYYIDPRIHGSNPFSVDQGMLRISAESTPERLRAQTGGSRYTSGLLTSQKSFSQLYGRFEIRAKVPAGRGLWPAFWLLPTFEQWPEGVAILPEIDVMEFIGSEPGTYHTTVHSNETGELKSYPYDHNNLGDLSRDFHAYTVVWDAEQISWYFDGRHMVSHATPADLHQPMHFLLNLAVGGNWAGEPDSETPFPAVYEIDYVRAYTRLANCAN